MILSGLEPAQCINQLRHRVLHFKRYWFKFRERPHKQTVVTAANVLLQWLLYTTQSGYQGGDVVVVDVGDADGWPGDDYKRHRG